MIQQPFEVRQIEFEKSGTKAEHFPTAPLPQIAFVGRSNVGKSSLLNVLANRRQLARVSSTPGRTQLINFFRVNRDECFFVDLPGYGFAKVPPKIRADWDRMISSYLTDTPALKGVVALFDIRREPTDEDLVLLQWLAHHGLPLVAVMTKADKLNRMHQQQAVRKLVPHLQENGAASIVLFSALKRTGREDLLQSIEELLAAE